MLLTVREAAKLLGANERTVYRWISEGNIPVHKIHDQHRFNRSELLEWATANGVRVSATHFSAPESVVPTPPPPVSHFADALACGGIHEHVEGNDRDSVLRAVVKRMPVAEEDRELLFDVLVARESLGSTGVGDGIAIPHVRSPVVLHVTKPSVTLSYLEHEVEFAAIDGKPVHTVFSIVTPTIRLHLLLLSQIAAALHDAGFREAVMNKAPAPKVLEHARRVESTFAQPPLSPNGPQ
jgi:PTS system nitrogen regulatory IIA component